MTMDILHLFSKSTFFTGDLKLFSYVKHTRYSVLLIFKKFLTLKKTKYQNWFLDPVVFQNKCQNTRTDVLLQWRRHHTCPLCPSCCASFQNILSLCNSLLTTQAQLHPLSAALVAPGRVRPAVSPNATHWVRHPRARAHTVTPRTHRHGTCHRTGAQGRCTELTTCPPINEWLALWLAKLDF